MEKINASLDELLEGIKSDWTKLGPLIDPEAVREPQGLRTEGGLTRGEEHRTRRAFRGLSLSLSGVLRLRRPLARFRRGVPSRGTGHEAWRIGGPRCGPVLGVLGAAPPNRPCPPALKRPAAGYPCGPFPSLPLRPPWPPRRLLAGFALRARTHKSRFCRRGATTAHSKCTPSPPR